MEKIDGISIIVPVYNGEETLDECLEVISKIEIPENLKVEYIIVNDGSIDRTGNIIDSWNEKIDLRVINHEKNSGRIKTRLDGAVQAKFKTLLFIDSRVFANSDIIVNFLNANVSPVMGGDYDDQKYGSEVETVFYLVRRRFYYPYYPQTKWGECLAINKTNFTRAPKGTTLLFIDRDLFIELTPEDTSSVKSDDTALFKTLVFDKNITLYRHTGIKAKYQHRKIDNLNSWLYNRGKLWADYYILRRNPISYVFFGMIFLIIVLLLTFPKTIIITLFIFFLLIVEFLKENNKDRLILYKTFPKLLLLFLSGVCSVFIRKNNK
ncbi:MAG: glycosyltransferase [Candidatus Delongbacteria bacterium]|nr:glycosyltransferase [Candidatus Delongbacteria bacterium]MBN2835872.1 glycosyltransferase [Candidatus Delongbacteria bacterium]